eukprot:CAMPEP_0178987598 /NCGR_PEP_ID=MMETSP0795-20121207/3349_1 /TAXON_ID=88552 /ORGANISM="Amoebophrya sp., Strain Ameob2" /LENGTH=1004 /DNA_ID=CAMNT_0020678789 /DNA_START=109 /DNA_END=3123 /DNA_ORIENTATION=-
MDELPLPSALPAASGVASTPEPVRLISARPAEQLLQIKDELFDEASAILARMEQNNGRKLVEHMEHQVMSLSRGSNAQPGSPLTRRKRQQLETQKLVLEQERAKLDGAGLESGAELQKVGGSSSSSWNRVKSVVKRSSAALQDAGATKRALAIRSSVREFTGADGQAANTTAANAAAGEDILDQWTGTNPPDRSDPDYFAWRRRNREKSETEKMLALSSKVNYRQASPVKTTVFAAGISHELIQEKMAEDLKEQIEKVKKFGREVFEAANKLKDKSLDLEGEKKFFAEQKELLLEEREAVLKRGKLAERLAGITPDDPHGARLREHHKGSEWMYTQLNAYKNEIRAQMQQLARTQQKTSDLESVNLEMRLAAQEVEHSDLPRKQKLFADTEKLIEFSEKQHEGVRERVAELEEEVAKLQKEKVRVHDEEVRLKGWLEKERKKGSLEDANVLKTGEEEDVFERRKRAEDQRLQNVIDIAVPWLVLLKNQNEAYEEETRDYMQFVAAVESHSSSATRVQLQKLRLSVHQTVMNIVKEAETVLAVLPKLNDGEKTALADQVLVSANIGNDLREAPKRLLQHIDSEREKYGEEIRLLDTSIANLKKKAQTFVVDKIQHKVAVRRLPEKAAKGVYVRIVFHNQLEKRLVKAGKDNALLFAGHLGGKETPQIYLDDVLALRWGKEATLYQQRPDVISPWLTFSLLVYQNHGDTDEDFDNGNENRIQMWDFVCEDDEQMEFWMLYLHEFCPHLQPKQLTRRRFVRQRKDLKLELAAGGTGKKNYSELLRRAVRKALLQRAISDSGKKRVLAGRSVEINRNDRSGNPRSPLAVRASGGRERVSTNTGVSSVAETNAIMARVEKAGLRPSTVFVDADADHETRETKLRSRPSVNELLQKLTTFYSSDHEKFAASVVHVDERLEERMQKRIEYVNESLVGVAAKMDDLLGGEVGDLLGKAMVAERETSGELQKKYALTQPERKYFGGGGGRREKPPATASDEAHEKLRLLYGVP